MIVVDPPSWRVKIADCVGEVLGSPILDRSTCPITMVFQPIWAIQGDDEPSVVGYEALARFPEPAAAEALAELPSMAAATYRGFTPGVWFAHAYIHGLLTDLELACLRVAMAAWADLPAGVYLSVNLSAEAILDPRFIAVLAQACESAPGFVLGRFVLELTEHSPVGNYEQLLGVLAPLRAGGLGLERPLGPEEIDAIVTGNESAGMRLAVDDVGAGYSSMRHILMTRPNLFKLDLSLIRGIARPRNHPERELVRGIVSFARSLTAGVVAEGIEDADDLVAVRLLGIDFAQGFFLGRPGPLPPVRLPK